MRCGAQVSEDFPMGKSAGLDEIFRKDIGDDAGQCSLDRSRVGRHGGRSRFSGYAQCERAGHAQCDRVSNPSHICLLRRSSVTAHLDCHPPRGMPIPILEIFRSLDAVSIIERLEKAQIANARMNTMLEFLDHPQLAARNRWRDIGSPVGKLFGLIPPADIEGVEPVMGSIPEVGSHSDQILKEIGFDEGTIAALRQTGLI